MRNRCYVAFLFVLLVLTTLCIPLWAERVTQEMAQMAVASQLRVERQLPPPGLEDIVYNISLVRELRREEPDGLLGYVFELSPWGYIIISPETRLRPVIAYSYRSDFSWEEVPWNILLDMLRLDLGYRLEAVEKGIAREGITSRNEQEWNIYLEKVPGVRLKVDKTVYGPLIQFPTWRQGSPWNNNCPIDPETGNRSVAGCVATALSQIINYWRYPASISFNSSDSYYTSTRNIYIDAPAASLSSISYNSDPTQNPSNQTMADVSYAAGVSVRMDYTSEGSGTMTYYVAAALAGSPVPYDPGGVWGYTSADVRTYYYSGGSPFDITQTEFYNLLSSNMQSGWPVQLAIEESDDGGHSIVCDGYRDDTGYYHLNFGWGGTDDGWYDLPTGMPRDYDILKYGVLNILPPGIAPGSITVVKQVVGQPPGSAWGFSGDLGSFTLPASGGQQTFSALDPGSYTITETTKPDYTVLVSCDTGESGTNSVTVDLDPYENATCTFTNTKKGMIIIEKVTNPAGGSGFGFMDNIASPTHSFNLNDGQNKTFTNVEPGIYTVTENDPLVTPGGYNLTGLVCVEDEVDNSTEDLDNRRATIQLDPGETVTCTFTNTCLLPTVTSITPQSGVNTGSRNVTLFGSNFVSGTTVKLTKAGQSDIIASSVNVVSLNKLTCIFDLTGQPTGVRDVAVTNPCGQSGTLKSSFTINTPVSPPIVWEGTDLGYGADGMSSVAVGDGDNDGDLETYGANGDGHLHQFKWNGSSWTKTDVGSGGSLMNGVAVGDGDNDGKLEAYGANDDHRLYQFKWNGSSWVKTDMGSGLSSMLSVAVGDGDNDGKLEVYGGNWDNYLYQFKWNGSSWAKTDVGSARGMFAVAVGDVENSGDIILNSAGSW